MPKWIEVSILGAILTWGVGAWVRASNDHDALVRIETQLNSAKEATDKSDRERAAAQGDMQAWREVMNGNLKKIEGMLTQQQVDALDRFRKKNPNQSQ